MLVQMGYEVRKDNHKEGKLIQSSAAFCRYANSKCSGRGGQAWGLLNCHGEGLLVEIGELCCCFSELFDVWCRCWMYSVAQPFPVCYVIEIWYAKVTVDEMSKFDSLLRLIVAKVWIGWQGRICTGDLQFELVVGMSCVEEIGPFYWLRGYSYSALTGSYWGYSIRVFFQLERVVLVCLSYV